MIAQKKTELTARVERSLKRKATRRRVIRYGLIALNVAILAGAVSFVFAGSHTDKVASAFAGTDTGEAVSPVDRLTSYDIAANVARITSLPEKTAITNQAQSAKVAMAVSTSSDSGVSAKPQIVATALKSRKDIQQYTVNAGDTVASIAQKFGVTSDSIRWSNGLATNSVGAGVRLNIPPVNGIVYVVKAGDTPQSLAAKYHASVDQIVAYNDAELSGLTPGEKIIIPGGQSQAPTTAASLFSVGSFTATYGGNGYDFGYCTWYVATQVSVPTNWGNANTWAYYAALSGWTVSSRPRVGAIAQTSRGYEGHVAMVQGISPDGSQVLIRDMNGIAGWGRVGVAWEATSKYEHYIYH